MLRIATNWAGVGCVHWRAILLPLQQLPQLRMDLLEMVGAHSLYHLLEGNYHHQGLWSQVD